jgi:MFS family permease
VPALPRSSDLRGDHPSRGLTAVCAAIACALLATCVWLARQEYFFGDDFIYLRQAQGPRDWLHVFLPLGKRGWWSYRPLSIEVFFSLLYRLVGLASTPYLLASIALHFATGLLAYRIARQLALDRRVALAVSVLSLGMYPTLNGELFWASVFQTISGTFFYVLAITLFADFLSGRGRVYRVGAALAMVVALGCNELAMTLPGPLVLLAAHFGQGTLVERMRSALASCASLIAILLVYVPFRYVVIGPSVLPTPALNVPHLGWHILYNVVVLLQMLMTGSLALQVVVLAVVVAGWAAAARAGDGQAALLARRVVLLAGWLGCTMVPYLGAYFVPHRAAIVMETPFCLLLAAHLDPLVRAATTVPARRLAEAGLVALIVVAFPFAVVREQARAPRGAVNRQLLELIAQESPQLPPGGCVRIQTLPGDTWTATDIFALGFRTSGVLAAARPGLRLELPVETGQPQSWRTDCAGRLDLELLHGPPAERPSFRLRVAPGPPAA